jgi:threonylcarbamoyladenosine tRNA methylthiotransferase MtaB
MRVYFSNLGCKLNQAELEALAREFDAAGHSIARSLDQADLHVVNTCTVTHVAARASRKLARRGLRINPHLKTVLTGCFVSEEPQRAAALAGVDLVVANHEKQHLLRRVEAAFPEARPLGAPAGAATSIPHVPLAFGNARALVKVEDGCNMRCSFCIIPRTRGRQVSRPLDEVIREVADLAAGGFREVVLTGVQISSYRHRGAGLHELVRALLDRTDVARLRLSSIAPWQFDRRLLDLFSTGRLCRHFHLSLQSGCDATLARMRRPYTIAAFEALASEIRRRVPGVAITTDVIVGFPGETEEEFATSLATVRRLRCARVHAFPYSSRPGTEAAELPDPVEPRTVKERIGRMLVAAETSREAFQRGHVGREAEVLWEAKREGVWHGTTDNYLSVTVSSRRDLRRVLAPARLCATSGMGLAAELTGSAA